MSHTTPEKELKSLGPAQFMGRRIKRLSFSSTVKSVSYTVRYFLYLGFLVLFIGFAGQNLLLVSSFREVLLDVSAPLFNIVDGPIEGIHQFWQQVGDVLDLATHTKDIKTIESERDYWKGYADKLERENTDYKKALSIVSGQTTGKPGPYGTLKASVRVIANPGGFYARNIILDGGIKQEIQKGDSVIVSQGLVGRIIEAGQKASRVLLISDVESRVPVVLETSGLQAVVAGRNDAFLNLLRLEEDISKPKPTIGERLLTSGLGGIFPPGIPVGVLDADVSGNYHVKPYANLDRLNLVSVLFSFQSAFEDVGLPSPAPDQLLESRKDVP